MILLNLAEHVAQGATDGARLLRAAARNDGRAEFFGEGTSEVLGSNTKGRMRRKSRLLDQVIGGSALMRPVNMALRRNDSQKSSAVCPNAITLALSLRATS